MLSVTDHGYDLVLSTGQRAGEMRSEHGVRLLGSRELCALRLSHGSESSASPNKWTQEDVEFVSSQYVGRSRRRVCSFSFCDVKR